MDVLAVLDAVGGALVVALVVIAVAIDWDNCYPMNPTKKEWRRH